MSLLLEIFLLLGLQVLLDRALWVHVLDFPLAFEEFLPLPMAVEFTMLLPREEIPLAHYSFVRVMIACVLVGVARVGHLLFS
jgi:hypothetical protein